MVTWARHEDGIALYKNGQLVGIIPVNKLPAFLYDLAARLREG